MSGAESDPDSGTRFDVLIVGAGHAGVHVAATLAGSFEGSIGLLSAERREPYERPPLTKAFLVGDVTEPETAGPVSGLADPGDRRIQLHARAALAVPAQQVPGDLGTSYPGKQA